MGKRTTVNLSQLSKDVARFKEDRSANNIDQKAELIERSGGTVINEINECLSEYNAFCNNYNRVYASTERYLEQVLSNFENADSDNTLN